MKIHVSIKNEAHNSSKLLWHCSSALRIKLRGLRARTEFCPERSCLIIPPVISVSYPGLILFLTSQTQLFSTSIFYPLRNILIFNIWNVFFLVIFVNRDWRLLSSADLRCAVWQIPQHSIWHMNLSDTFKCLDNNWTPSLCCSWNRHNLKKVHTLW